MKNLIAYLIRKLKGQSGTLYVTEVKGYVSPDEHVPTFLINPYPRTTLIEKKNDGTIVELLTNENVKDKKDILGCGLIYTKSECPSTLATAKDVLKFVLKR